VSTPVPLATLTYHNSMPDGPVEPPRAPGADRTYLSKLEKGASHRGLEIIAKLASALEVVLAD
jgi:hypothetical protein